MLSGSHILLGVSGGIAAYKSAALLRDLQQQGAEVRVTMTPAATRFVGTETFTALSRQPVPVHIFDDQSDPASDWTRHIHWAEWADLMLIAPCTAQTLAKIVHGFSDSMLTSTVLAARSPVLLCPTMDGGMYHSQAVHRNLDLARRMGHHVLEPDHGYLASGLHDTGRMPDQEQILERVRSLLDDTRPTGHPWLQGKSVLVTAGPTREHLDPVRFLSNPSSGKMGIAMANAARRMGGQVTLLHGPVDTAAVDEGITCESFTSAEDLYERVKQRRQSDVVIMAAAVSDYTPESPEQNKIKKTEASESIRFRPTPDILRWLGKNRLVDQVLIGFAMETGNLKQNAAEKRERKQVDWIVANELNDSDSGFEHDTNRVLLLGEGVEETYQQSKDELARILLARIFGEPPKSESA